MVRIPPDQVQKEVDQEEDINYGTGYTDGDHEKFEDTGEMVKEVTGNEPEEGEPFEIAEEIKADEEDRVSGKPEDKEEEELVNELAREDASGE